MIILLGECRHSIINMSACEQQPLPQQDEHGELPTASKPNDSITVRISRSTKFAAYFLPILNHYRNALGKVSTLEKKRAKGELSEEKFMSQKTAVLDAAHTAASPMMVQLLEKMGGLYNKGAQDIVTRGLMVPKPLVDGLSHVFEDMPRRSWASLEKSVWKCLGRGDEKVGKKRLEKYLELNPEPIAAASIGQVHVARVVGSNKNSMVVVKILYPEIRKHMVADLSNMKQAALITTSMLGLDGIKDAIEALVLEVYDKFPQELDFTVEMAHTQYAIKLVSRHSPDIVIPRCYPKLSGTEVLVLSMVPGETINKIATSKPPNPVRIDQARSALAKVIDCLGEMIYRDGFFSRGSPPRKFDGSAGWQSRHD